MLLSDDIKDWILNMENFILNTCHGPGRHQRFNFEWNDWLGEINCFECSHLLNIYRSALAK